MFLYCSTCGITILVYVDDIIITKTDSKVIHKLQASVHSAFHMNDLGPLQYFLGLEMLRSSHGMFINQHEYTKDPIALARLENSSPVHTPLEFNVKYRKNEGELLSDSTIYRRTFGSLVYLTSTRPDISHAVNLVSEFMTTP